MPASAPRRCCNDNGFNHFDLSLWVGSPDLACLVLRKTCRHAGPSPGPGPPCQMAASRVSTQSLFPIISRVPALRWAATAALVTERSLTG